METFLKTPDAAQTLGIVGMFICITVIAVGCTVAVQWRKVRQTHMEVDLKKDMLERGMSADEIVKVLHATIEAARRTPQADAIELALKQHMLNLGLSADDIVKVLHASVPRAAT